MTGYLIGILWASQWLFALHFLSNGLSKKLLTTTMWCVVALFLVTQIIGQEINGILLESAMLLLQVALIFLSKKHDFRYLALAFFIHGSWDTFHILNQSLIHKPLIYSEICVPYDWIVTAYILWRNWHK
jgi:hypothetical protein